MIGLLRWLARRWRGDSPRATAARAPADADRSAPAAARGRVALLGHQLRYELIAATRDPRGRFVTLVFPVIMLVIFAGVFHGTTPVAGVEVTLARYFTAGILALSIVLSAYANLVPQIAGLRETGVLKRRRAKPVTPAILVGAQALATLLGTAVMSAVLLVVARLFFGIGIAPGGLAAIACVTVVGTLAFACLGYAVSGLVGSAASAQPIVQATTMPLWFISGVLIPTHNLSPGLRIVGELFPVEHLAAALHQASVSSSFTAALAPGDLLAVAVWGAAGAGFAVWHFSWLPETARI